MAQDDDKQRTKRDRIERLRQRVRKMSQDNPSNPLVPILKGILDLLADEL